MISMSEISYMTTEEIAVSLETAKLELRYQEVLRQAERIYEEERARALRVQLLLLEDDNDQLRDQMGNDEDEMQQLETTNEELHDQLTIMEAEFRAVQVESKTQVRDLERYKAEITALNTANTDSAKLLSEKLALTREVATLKPELEHLRSQATTQQNILAEKLSLERELSAMQVELETEKRAVQRLRLHDKTSGHGEAVMATEIEDLKKELAKEKRQTQKHERDYMKKTTDWESQKENLESKLDAFRTKLRTTKEQLKEAQDEIERAQAAKFVQSAEATKARMHGGNSKKRSVARFDPDMTIGTPGNGGPAKKQKLSIMPGDKSTFSITPFLNRTTSILQESPSEGNITNGVSKVQQSLTDGNVTDADHDVHVPPPKTTNQKEITKKPTAARPKASEPLKEITKSKVNKVVKKPALLKVVEEEPSENDSLTTANTAAAAEIKKTKLPSNRPTIFDDDEDHAPKRTTKKLNLAGLRGGSSRITLSKINLGGKNKVLAEFSPLKKERNLVF